MGINAITAVVVAACLRIDLLAVSTTHHIHIPHPNHKEKEGKGNIPNVILILTSQFSTIF